MAYPPGISLAVIQAGKAGTFFGDAASLTATVTPVLSGTKYLVHQSTGDLMVPSPMTFTASNDSVLSFSVPHVDQPGYMDDNAQAYTMWAYKVDVTVLIGNGRQVKKHTWTKNFQPLVGQDFIDIDTIASGNISEGVTAPMAEILSVNGQTGHVTIEAGGASDEDIAAFVNDPGSATKAVLNESYAPTAAPLASFLEAGEELPNAGIIDAQPLFQRAVDTLTAGVAFTGPRVITVPAGTYKLVNPIQWATGVGLKGESRNATILRPQGESSAILGNQTGTPTVVFEDCVFEDFTIDGADQSAAPAWSWTKGIFIQFMLRAEFNRVTIKNTWMTGFGLDYLRNVTFSQCYAENCGRGGTNNTGAGAGFGIATGYYDTETCTIVDCISLNNKTHGFFTENKWGKGTNVEKFTKGFTMTGCVASGNYEGFRDSGCYGAVISGCQFIDNTSNGAGVGPTPANFTGGHSGLVTGCTITGNGVDGVSLEEMPVGGYTFRGNTITNNTRYGVVRKTPGGAIKDVPVGPTIQGNRITGNGASGVCFLTTSSVTRLRIEDNEIADNGKTTGQANRDGITMYSSLTHPTIRRNLIYNTGGTSTQQYGVWLRGTTTTVQPVIQGNETSGHPGGGVSIGHTVADQQFVTGNYVLTPAAAAVASGTWSDNFNRADGVLTGQTTTTGGLVWAKHPPAANGDPVVISNAVGWAGADTNQSAVVNTGTPNGTFTATCAVIGAESSSAMVFRETDAGNYLGVKGRTSAADKRWTLVRRSAGTETILATLEAPATNGDVLEVVTSGTSVTVSVNGTQRWAGTISEHATATNFGVLGNSLTLDARWDDLAFTAA